MSAQMVFKRYELKYLLTREQKQSVLEAVESHNRNRNTIIRNVYFDTPDEHLQSCTAFNGERRLARRSTM